MKYPTAGELIKTLQCIKPKITKWLDNKLSSKQIINKKKLSPKLPHEDDIFTPFW